MTTRMLLAFLLLASGAAPAAQSQPLAVDGLRLGLTESELSTLYPTGFSCRAYKWRLDADKVCTSQGAFGKAAAISMSFKLIDDRVTDVQASLTYQHFEPVLASLEAQLGAPTRRNRDQS